LILQMQMHSLPKKISHVKALSDKRLLSENIEKSKITQLLDERALAYTKHH
jgi:hypothetical protein